MCQVNAVNVLCRLLLVDVAVVHLRGVTQLLQCFLQRLRQHHRPMLAARTTKRDRQITLPFGNVMWNQISQHPLNPLKELSRLRIRKDESPDLGILSAKTPQPRHEMGIRQESHVEHKVAVARQAVLIAKANQRNQEWPLVRRLKTLSYKMPQLMHV